MNELMAVTETFDLIQGYRDKDGVLHTEFEVREMTGADEEAISKPDIKNNGGKVVRTIIERCCTRIGTYYQKDTKSNKWREMIQDLSVGDQDFILLKIREMSLGEEIESRYKCPNPSCKEDIITTIEIDELEIVPFDGLHEIKVFIPESFGNGVMGEGPTNPIIGYDGDLCTETFLQINHLKDKYMAENVISYMKTKIFLDLDRDFSKI